MSLISVVTVGPAVAVGSVTGPVAGKYVADAAGRLVGNGEGVGIKVSVARATGEQAASPPSMPSTHLQASCERF
jgi:hypothetical protein